MEERRLDVLVVDDEPGMRSGVARALRTFGFPLADLGGEVAFDVRQAADGAAAEKAIATKLPDVLLLDYKLPDMTGLDLLKKLAPTDEMRTVMITAYASLETAVTAIKTGAYDFLAKPFTPAELKNTVRKAAESLVVAREARRLAAEKRAVRFQFISVLAHELKAPLAAIDGYLHTVRDRTAGDEQAVYDHMLDRSLARLDGMRKLIADLLDLTKIESGTRTRELKDVDLAEVAAAAIELCSVEAARRGIAVELHADGPVRLTADRGEIEMICNNLVSNAVKYNRDGGRVEVTLADRGERVELAVRDTGIGMTEAEAARLFGDFVRIRNARTRDILGSGLGLSTVRKLAELYGGQVAVASRPDVGSTFTVTLPRNPASPA